VIPFLIALQVLFASMLVLFILLHRGQGGGLSDMFGGAGGGMQGSAIVEKNLDRLTVVAAVGFLIVDILLVNLLSS
jgi:preprotein translocase subunit SecG